MRATFTIIDTTAPRLEAPVINLTVSDDGLGNQIDLSLWMASRGGSVVEDTARVAGLIPVYTAETEIIGSTDDAIAWSILPATCPTCRKVTECSLTQIYDFHATDSCGNTLKTTGRFVARDNTAPTLVVPAADYRAEDDGVGNKDELRAWLTSNGGASMTDSVSSFRSDGGSQKHKWRYKRSRTKLTSKSAGLNPDSDVNACALVQTYEFSSEDECGQVTSTSADFRIVDSTPPEVVQSPADLYVEDDGKGNTAEVSAWLSKNGGAIATDRAATAGILSNYDLNASWPPSPVPVFSAAALEARDATSCTVTQPYEFSAWDSCGNARTAIATVVIADTRSPTVDQAPLDQRVESDGAGNLEELSVWLAVGAGMTASDVAHELRVRAAGGEMISISAAPSASQSKLMSACLNSTAYTFTATDACGNSISRDATFTAVDSAPPVIKRHAQSITVSDDGAGNKAELSKWLAAQGHARAIDAGTRYVKWSSPETVDFETLRYSSTCTVQRARATFTATDSCGASAETIADFIVADRKAPIIISSAKSAYVECDGQGNGEELQIWLDAHAHASIEEEATWTYTEPVFKPVNSDGSCPDKMAEVTFTATDGCGNSVSTTAQFFIEDTTPPSFVVGVQTESAEDTQEAEQAIAAWISEHGGAQVYDIGTTEEYCGTSLAPEVISSAGFEHVSCDTCSNEPEPCCAFDGTTEFINPCHAHCSGAHSFTTGMCDNLATPAVADDESWSCVCGEPCVHAGVSGTCQADQRTCVLNFAPPVCSDIPPPVATGSSAVETCLQFCKGSGTPVCVSEQKEHASACAAHCHGDHDFEPNACPTTSTAGDHCFCKARYDPVCVDGAEFPNPCFALCAGHRSWSKGSCVAARGSACQEPEWHASTPSMPSGQCPRLVEVIFTAADACGNQARQVGRFELRDTTPPVISIPPTSVTIPNNGDDHLGNHVLKTWLKKAGGAQFTGAAVTSRSSITIERSDGICSTFKGGVSFYGSDECHNTVVAEAAFAIADNEPPLFVKQPEPLVVERDWLDGTHEAAIRKWFESNGGARIWDRAQHANRMHCQPQDKVSAESSEQGFSCVLCEPESAVVCARGRQYTNACRARCEGERNAEIMAGMILSFVPPPY